MKAISLKLPDELYAQLERLAKQRGESKSELVRAALVQFFGGKAPGRPLSVLDLAGDAVGGCSGPEDLSTNPKYLEDLGR